MELSEKAEKNNCVPVGAVVVKNGKIIGKGYNKKEKTNNPLDHAEIMAIRKATKKIKSWNLSGCILYVTMVPCEMCKTIINESRINEIYYLVDNEKEKYKNYKSLSNMKFNELNSKNNKEKYLTILREFFSQKRKKYTQNSR